MKTSIFLSFFIIFFGLNSNAQWVAVNSGITNLNVIPMAVNGTNHFAGTYGGGVFLSTNNGTNWTAVNNGITTLDIFSMTVSGSNVYAGTYGGGVFMTSNNGTSWTQVNNGITNFSTYAMASSGSAVYAGTLGGGVFKTTNNGTSWTAVNNGLVSLNVVTLFTNGSNLYAGTSGGGAFLSTDDGATWTAINTGLTSTTVRSFTASGSNLFAGTGGGGIFLSTNNGASWTAANTGLTNMTVWTMKAVGTELFAGTAGGGVFQSSDNGNSWTAINTGLTASPDVWSIAVNGTNLYLGINGGAGVYRRPLSEVGGTTTATFNYNATGYCANDSDPIPAVTGTSGGVFSSTAGLSINSVTGEVDLSASTPGTYVITYSVGGSSTDETISINALDDASFSYANTDYCKNDSDPTPIVSGTTGGTFSSTAGLSIDASTGEIDLGNSTPGLYIVSYQTSGVCPNSAFMNVIITEVDAATSLNGFTISANTTATGATFQWLDCDNGMNPIAGETGSSFTATANGNYAVEVTENSCIDTSACQAITTIGLDENSLSDQFTVYPNPTNGKVFISFDSNQSNLHVAIYSVDGKLIQSIAFDTSTIFQLDLAEPAGVYLLEISDEEGRSAVVRLVKE